MVFKALRTSRGYGKFVRNRAALVALGVITAYFVLAGWVLLTEVVQWVGTDGARWVHRRTHGTHTGAGGGGGGGGATVAADDPEWWDLSRSPLLGLLLASSAEKRVGPKWVNGFFIPPSSQRREDQLYFLFEQAQKAVRAAEAKGSLTGEQTRAVLDEFSLSERRVADRPAGELRRVLDEAEGRFRQLEGLKKRRTQVDKAERAVVTINDAARAARGLPADAPVEQVKAAIDDLGRSVEELTFVLDDYAALRPLEADAPGAGADPLLAVDAAPIRALSDRLLGPGPPAPSALALPEGALEGVRVAAARVREAIEPPLNSALDQVQPLVEQLMPWPRGLAGVLYDFKLLLGTDTAGNSIMVRSLYSAKIAVQVGCVVALTAVLIGAVFGSAAGFFGGWTDHAVTWMYSTLSALPQLVLLGVISFMFLGSSVEKTLIPVYVALTATFWIGTCRVVRGEVLKLKELEYVQAGKAIGFSRVYILARHVLPNTMHLLFINFSLLFIGAVKSEVVLTYLGLGIKDGASWGRMISASTEEVVAGFFWQIGAATFFMLVLVLAFNILSDALQDAFDPRHVG